MPARRRVRAAERRSQVDGRPNLAVHGAAGGRAFSAVKPSAADGRFLTAAPFSWACVELPSGTGLPAVPLDPKGPSDVQSGSATTGRRSSHKGVRWSAESSASTTVDRSTVRCGARLPTCDCRLTQSLTTSAATSGLSEIIPSTPNRAAFDILRFVDRPDLDGDPALCAS